MVLDGLVEAENLQYLLIQPVVVVYLEHKPILDVHRFKVLFLGLVCELLPRKKRGKQGLTVDLIQPVKERTSTLPEVKV